VNPYSVRIDQKTRDLIGQLAHEEERSPAVIVQRAIREYAARRTLPQSAAEYVAMYEGQSAK
jgi:predicted transcriptional regulator